MPIHANRQNLVDDRKKMAILTKPEYQPIWNAVQSHPIFTHQKLHWFFVESDTILRATLSSNEQAEGFRALLIDQLANNQEEKDYFSRLLVIRGNTINLSLKQFARGYAGTKAVYRAFCGDLDEYHRQLPEFDTFEIDMRAYTGHESQLLRDLACQEINFRQTDTDGIWVSLTLTEDIAKSLKAHWCDCLQLENNDDDVYISASTINPGYYRVCISQTSVANAVAALDEDPYFQRIKFSCDSSGYRRQPLPQAQQVETDTPFWKSGCTREQLRNAVEMDDLNSRLNRRLGAPG